MRHNTLTNPLKKNRKRVGRGIAAGQGKTAGRGHKGQNSRSGKKLRTVFEGGQTSLFMKIPKLRGFKNPNYVEYQVVNLKDLEKIQGEEVNVETLASAGIINTSSPVKILSTGDVSKKYNVVVDAISATAKEKIEKAGGKVEVLLKKEKREKVVKPETIEKVAKPKTKEGKEESKQETKEEVEA